MTTEGLLTVVNDTKLAMFIKLCWNVCVHSTEQLLTPELNIHSSPHNNGHFVIFLQASSQPRKPCVSLSDA